MTITNARWDNIVPGDLLRPPEAAYDRYTHSVLVIGLKKLSRRVLAVHVLTTTGIFKQHRVDHWRKLGRWSIITRVK